jgi:hypothetical protein
MKRQWTVHRQFEPCPDGEQRWDRVYQYLLKWAITVQPPPTVTEPPSSPPTFQEVDHAGSRLCSCVHSEPGSTADD